MIKIFTSIIKKIDLTLLFFIAIIAMYNNFNNLKGESTKKDSLEKYVISLIQSNQTIIIKSQTFFQNDIIQDCFDSMAQENNFIPLEKLWLTIKENDNDFFANDFFLKEFCLLLLIIYESTIDYITKQSHNKSSTIPLTLNSWFGVISLYLQLSALPLGRLIESLEQCWQQYNKIMQGYVIEGEYSLVRWLNVFWWIIPTTFVWFIVTVARNQKT